MDGSLDRREGSAPNRTWAGLRPAGWAATLIGLLLCAWCVALLLLPGMNAAFSSLGHYRKGCMAAADGRVEDSVRLLRIAVREAPNNSTILAGAANALMMADRPREAVPLLRQALRLRPRAAGQRVELALALASCRESAAALSEIRSALAQNPESPRAHAVAAMVHLAAGRLELAKTEAETSVSLPNSDSYSLEVLAEVLTTMGRPDAALRELRRGVDLYPDDCRAHLKLAEALASGADRARALEHLSTAESMIAGTGLQPRAQAIRLQMGSAGTVGRTRRPRP